MPIRWGSKPWKLWSSHWHNRHTFKGLRLPLALLAMVFLGLGLGYLAINYFSEWRGWTAFDPETRFDSMIPVIPWMILPYYALYFYYPMAGLLGMKNDKTQREVIIFHQILLILTIMIFGIFLILPAEVDLRGSVLDTDLGIWHTWFELLYGVDNPWNAWPSLHIVQSMLIVLIIHRWFSNDGRKATMLLGALWFAWALLVISITTTKQHYVWDAISALIVGFLAWRYWIAPALDKCHEQEVVELFNQL